MNCIVEPSFLSADARSKILSKVPSLPIYLCASLVDPKENLSPIAENWQSKLKNPRILQVISQKNSKFPLKKPSLYEKIASPVSLFLLHKGKSSGKILVNPVKLDENNKFILPLSGNQVLSSYQGFLTDSEAAEIAKYDQIYYFPCKSLTKTDFSDQNGVYKAKPQDHLIYRYEILALLGKGTFGHVYKCFDHKHSLTIAVKILRKGQSYRKQGENEIKNLEILNKDFDENKNLVKMFQCFEFRGHLCIAFELLHTNLYQFLKNSHPQGLNLNLIKRIALQVLIALRHIHGLGMIHSDLKLENILLKNDCKSSIKVIDFGSAITHSNPLFSYLQSRFYRAPEVILGCGYDNKIDMWSFGCILVELYKGKALFPGENEKDQLFRIVKGLGEPPREMIEKALRKSVFFYDDFTLRLKKNQEELKIVHKDLFQCEESGFKDFVAKCLVWDPASRFSANEALKHPWITGTRDQKLRCGRVLFCN